MTRPTTVAEATDRHQQQLAARRWLRVTDLAARWGISRKQVRAIPRTSLPYLEFGKSKERRYNPELVAAFEERAA